MASLTQWTWVWASSRRWWRTGKPGVLQSMGSQRVGHNLATEQHAMISSISPVQLYTTLCTVTCQAPLSMGILQARILEWVAMPSCKTFVIASHKMYETFTFPSYLKSLVFWVANLIVSLYWIWIMTGHVKLFQKKHRNREVTSYSGSCSTS